jgi:2,4-dienoyl-CoA reductase-like NADH-dependent reductase (Old Yellow Enzyme family)
MTLATANNADLSFQQEGQHFCPRAWLCDDPGYLVRRAGGWLEKSHRRPYAADGKIVSQLWHVGRFSSVEL